MKIHATETLIFIKWWIRLIQDSISSEFVSAMGTL